jgi:hypothetical protein
MYNLNYCTLIKTGKIKYPPLLGGKGKETGQQVLPCSKRRETGAAYAAPDRNRKKWGQQVLPPLEMKRNGGSTRCPRLKGKETGQQVLPRSKGKETGQHTLPCSKRHETGAALAAPHPPPSSLCPRGFPFLLDPPFPSLFAFLLAPIDPPSSSGFVTWRSRAGVLLGDVARSGRSWRLSAAVTWQMSSAHIPQ